MSLPQPELPDTEFNEHACMRDQLLQSQNDVVAAPLPTSLIMKNASNSCGRLNDGCQKTYSYSSSDIGGECPLMSCMVNGAGEAGMTHLNPGFTPAADYNFMYSSQHTSASYLKESSDFNSPDDGTESDGLLRGAFRQSDDDVVEPPSSSLVVSRYLSGVGKRNGNCRPIYRYLPPDADGPASRPDIVSSHLTRNRSNIPVADSHTYLNDGYMANFIKNHHTDINPEQLKHQRQNGRLKLRPDGRPVATPCYQCRLCEKMFLRQVDLAVHARVHVAHQLIECTYCGQHFKRQSSLTEHLVIHTGVKWLSCKQCGAECYSLAALKLHRLRCLQPPVLYTCYLCDKQFSLPANLMSHLRIHMGVKPFSCRFCEKSFSDRSHLTRHERIHTGYQPYGCELCGRRFNQSGSLKNHVKTHLTDDSHHRCQFCPCRFRQATGLVTHIQKAHDLECHFHCPYCSSRFFEVNRMKAHMHARHGNESPYRCQACGARFFQFGSLKNHIRRSHM